MDDCLQAGNIFLHLAKSLTLNKKWVQFLVIIILAIIVFFVKRYQASDKPQPTKDVTDNRPKDPASDVNRNRGFDRRVSYIEYTEHAKCRMQVLNIALAYGVHSMRDGKINYAKSDVNDRPCPTYALEGVTKDDQRVRIVFAQCDLKTKVVTSIDLDTDWECHCPGDDSKNKNKN